MATFNLRRQLVNHMTSLFEEQIALKAPGHRACGFHAQKGLLNEQFHQFEVLRDAHSNNAGLLTRSITAFFDSIEKHLEIVESLLNGDDVDFTSLYHTVFKIRGSSATLGAQPMKLAIRPLIQRCMANDKNGCVEALQAFKREYQSMRARLEQIVQLETIILQYEQN